MWLILFAFFVKASFATKYIQGLKITVTLQTDSNGGSGNWPSNLDPIIQCKDIIGVEFYGLSQEFRCTGGINLNYVNWNKLELTLTGNNTIEENRAGKGYITWSVNNTLIDTPTIPQQCELTKVKNNLTSCLGLPNLYPLVTELTYVTWDTGHSSHAGLIAATVVEAVFLVLLILIILLLFCKRDLYLDMLGLKLVSASENKRLGYKPENVRRIEKIITEDTTVIQKSTDMSEIVITIEPEQKEKEVVDKNEVAIQAIQEVKQQATLTDPIKIPSAEASVQVQQSVTEQTTLTDPPRLSFTVPNSDGYWEETVINIQTAKRPVTKYKVEYHPYNGESISLEQLTAGSVLSPIKQNTSLQQKRPITPPIVQIAVDDVPREKESYEQDSDLIYIEPQPVPRTAVPAQYNPYAEQISHQQSSPPIIGNSHFKIEEPKTEQQEYKPQPVEIVHPSVRLFKDGSKSRGASFDTIASVFEPGRREEMKRRKIPKFESQTAKEYDDEEIVDEDIDDEYTVEDDNLHNRINKSLSSPSNRNLEIDQREDEFESLSPLKTNTKNIHAEFSIDPPHVKKSNSSDLSHKHPTSVFSSTPIDHEDDIDPLVPFPDNSKEHAATTEKNYSRFIDKPILPGGDHDNDEKNIIHDHLDPESAPTPPLPEAMVDEDPESFEYPSSSDRKKFMLN